LLSAFGAKTSRNAPSNSRFIFGPSTWLRNLIRPGPGRALAYVDWCQQEFGIAAALSRDAAMMDAYCSGDPYLAFAKQAGAVTANATKQTHGPMRDAFKACVLAVQYGMGEVSLAQRIGQCPARARELLMLHRQTYRTYWRWSESAVNHAMLLGFLPTVFGWRVHVGPDANTRSLANFPMQANGAEMLRLACCLATERGIQVCAPVHDALLVEGDADGIDETVTATQAAMREASAIVLAGFELRTDAKIVRYPDNYMDERGKSMWETVWRIVAELEAAQAEPFDLSQKGTPQLSQKGTPTCPVLGHPSPLISLISSSSLQEIRNPQLLLLNLDELRLPSATVAEMQTKAGKSNRPPRHRPQGEFLKGPIPLTWLVPACRLSGRTLALALALWFQAGRRKRREVNLSGPILKRFNVTRKSLYRGLKALQAASLVSVVKRPGKNPTVTILDPPTDASA
jgi:hypothetical protein